LTLGLTTTTLRQLQQDHR